MSRSFRIIISRSPQAGGPTVAIVDATVHDDWCGDWEKNPTNTGDANLLQSCIMLAVQEWFEGTHEGRTSLANSCYDWNIGDLCMELSPNYAHAASEEPRSIERYLRKLGIEDLKIETFDEPDDNSFWDYDDHLFDATEVNEERAQELYDEEDKS